MFRLACSSLLLLGIILWGCTDDEPTGPEPNSIPEFPNSVGTQWVYAVFDSIRETTDTITIAITDTTTLPQTGELASIWIFDPPRRFEDRYYGHIYDSLFVVSPASKSGGDTIKVYIRESAPEPAWIYMIPMSVGDYWSWWSPYDLLPDSSHVEELTTVTTPSDTYTDVYLVSRRYNCGDECGGQLTYWFKPGTGIVMSNRIEIEWDFIEGVFKPTIIASWVLLEHTPSP